VLHVVHASSHLFLVFLDFFDFLSFFISSFFMSSFFMSSFSCHRASSDPASCSSCFILVLLRIAGVSEGSEGHGKKTHGHELRNQLLHTSSWCDVAPESQTGAFGEDSCEMRKVYRLKLRRTYLADGSHGRSGHFAVSGLLHECNQPKTGGSAPRSSFR